MFISLNVEPATPRNGGCCARRTEGGLEAKDVPVKEGLWGYRILVVDDPDGNQLFFNYPNEPASTDQRLVGKK